MTDCGDLPSIKYLYFYIRLNGESDKMQKIHKLLAQCPVETLMSVFFLGYLIKYGPFYDNRGEWPPPTKDNAMIMGLLVTMMVRIVVSRFTSFRYGLITSIITGLVVTSLFFLDFVVDSILIMPTFLICFVICFFMFHHTDRKEQFSKTILLMVSTIVAVVLIYFVASFVMELTKECLGPDDALVVEAYASVGGTAFFIVWYQIINEMQLKEE